MAGPVCADHTWAPEGYVAWHRWADTKSRTHFQVQCTECNRWKIWLPKNARSDARRATLSLSDQSRGDSMYENDSYQPGDILDYTWGYDQTNIDFFVITKRTVSPKGVIFLTLQEVESATSDEIGFMTYKVTPARDADGNLIPKTETVWIDDKPVKQVAKPIRRKLHVSFERKPGHPDADGFGDVRREFGVAIRSYGWCSTWSGNPVTSTSYA